MSSKSVKEVPLTAQLRAEFERLSSNDNKANTSIDEWKALGNKCYENESYLTAIKCYTFAINMEGGDQAVMRSNRSAAYLKSSMFAGPSLALKDAERAAELDPKWYKAHLRVADAQYARNKLEEANAAYQRALALCPTCTSAQDALHRLKTDLFLQKLEAEEHKRELDGIRTEDDDSNTLPHNKTTHCNSCTSSTNFTSDGAGTNREEGTRAKYEFHNAPIDAEEQNSNKRRPPTEEETTHLVQAWKEDTCVREGHTALKPRPVSLEEANRTVGKAYKEQLLSQFRHKLTRDETFKESIEGKLEKEKLAGEDVDYRRAEEYKKRFAHSTNGIGLAISTDAYKDYIGIDTKW